MEIRLIESPEEFRAVGKAWNDLLGRSAADNIFLSHEWLGSWWDVFGGGKRLAIGWIEEGGAPVGIAPFYLETARFAGGIPATQLFLIGNRSVGSDFLDFILLKGRERELLPRLVGLLLERLRWDRLVVDDVDAESGTCALLRDEASARRIPLLARRRYRCPWMELPGSWDAFMEIPDRVFKRIVQREGVKKLWKRHAVELSLATPESDLDANLDTLFALSRQRWQETDVTGCFEDPMVRDFYRRVSVPLTRNDWLRLSVLKVDGTPRAAEYGMAYGGAYYSLQGGCDAEGFRLRAGHVLQYKVFESLVGKVRSFQFLRGEESYKYQWGCADRRTVQLILARTPKGWSMSAARKAQDGAKRVAKAFLRRFGLRPRRA